jgi:hypothetical protein
MRRLEHIHVFVVERNGDEHVAAYVNPRLARLEPMIAATEEKLEELTRIAQDLVSLNPTEPMRIVRFDGREDVAEVTVPSDPQDESA